MFRLKCFSTIASLLLILSVFAGAIHEGSHNHNPDDTCEVCLVAHTPALIDISLPMITIATYYEPFLSAQMLFLTPIKITLRSRSPPIG